MAGHGGARAGAGAPRGGISETKRLLLRGLRRGLALAGADKGFTGTEDEIAVESVAQITRELIHAGQGRDILAILAAASPKADDDGDGKKSPLLSALERLPGMGKGPAAALPAAIPGKEHGETAQDISAATDPQSEAAPFRPVFTPQFPLLAPGAPAAPTTMSERAPAARPRAEGGGTPPYPGVAAGPPALPSRPKF